MDKDKDKATTATTSAFEPTNEQATFRFVVPPAPSPSPSPPKPSVEEVVDEDAALRTPSPAPASDATDPLPAIPTRSDTRPATAARTNPPRATPPPPDAPSDDPTIRTCRICFDTSTPPYEPSPELGRLISPCTCTGSSRYVHSGCLQRWRTTSNTAYYRCPTCHYTYRLRRLNIASFLSSTGLQAFLSVSILLTIIFALGFVSEPWLAAYVVDIPSVDALLEGRARGGWVEHFLRGAASLGLLGFLKVVYLLGPGSWWNLRQSGVLGGRDRVARLGWIVVAVGVANFFVWLWKKVGALVERRMQKVAWDVMEVGEEGRESVTLRGMVRGGWGAAKAGVAEVVAAARTAATATTEGTGPHIAVG
ncbi:hypothetical protein EDC01DRAFT_628438 [Geopyxis carbonaria]|nr:hypothetical protein EDC01DRAFT_628438 [Geopyxis carbonaria]